MESVTAEFLVMTFCAWDGFLNFLCLDFSEPTESSEWSNLGMSIEDEINHCVAAAYCRHNDFNFSTFYIGKKHN